MWVMMTAYQEPATHAAAYQETARTDVNATEHV